MGKAKSSFINMFLVLTIVCVVAATALAAVYKATADPIRISEENKQQEAIKAVLPPFDELKTEKKALDMETTPSIYHKEAGADSIVLHHAYLNGEEIGVAVETFTNKGFGGLIRLMAGFTADGQINKVSVLSHAETPGLGSKMTDPGFYTQFEGKNPADFKLQVKKDGGDVQAITAATISSRAYCDALNTAYTTIQNNK